MDAKEATRVVREYFESIKKIKFMFEVRNAEKKSELLEDDIWVIKCNIQNVFEEEPISYEVGVVDKTGDILYVKEIK
jgi:predicted small secreted protein